MSTKTNTTIKCNCCSESFSAAVYTCVNTAENPELRDSVKDGSIFIAKCPKCGATCLYQGPFLYVNPSDQQIIILSSAAIDDSDMDKSYMARQVASPGELIEKVKIFDDGLDDRAIELCKYITQQDMGSSETLKYLRLDGADGDLIFAYPKDGQMQMMSVPFSTYENCSAIVRRNPEFDQRSAGLSTIDENFISSILK